MTDDELAAFKQRLDLRRKGEQVLGRREWSLLTRYGKVMDGPHAGSYVSGLPAPAQLALLHCLLRGETVAVHLMHRHKSGCSEASSLRMSSAGLLMVFLDRVEDA